MFEPIPTLSKLLDVLNIKKLGRYILKLKQYRENKIQNVNNNLLNIPQHVTNENFQGQGEMMNVDTSALLGPSLLEAKNQRTTKCPRISCFKATRCGVEEIKKITECELH